MDIKKYKYKVKSKVIKPLVEHLNEYGINCGYDLFSVLQCRIYLMNYLRKLNSIKHPSDEQILKAVKRVVIALNKVNKSTKYTIFETDERESICEIIQNSAIECGLKEHIDDITEEWREW